MSVLVSSPLDDIITRHVPLTPVVVSVLVSSPLDDIMTRHVPLTPVVVSVLGSSPLDDIITRHVPLTPIVVSVLGFSPLDDIIDRLGGPNCVAEMTGRRGRIVRRSPHSQPQYELRDKNSPGGLDSINVKEVGGPLLPSHLVVFLHTVISPLHLLLSQKQFYQFQFRVISLLFSNVSNPRNMWVSNMGCEHLLKYFLPNILGYSETSTLKSV